MSAPNNFARSFQFHPFEISFVGFSGSGKTTLITRLLERFSKNRKLAYLKHDAHQFEMDHSGKDTWQATQAGAHTVAISDSSQWASIQKNSEPFLSLKDTLLDADWLFIEGYKSLPIKKIVLLDSKLEILQHIDPESVLAYVGPSNLQASVPIVDRDRVDLIAQLVEDYFFELTRSRPLKGLLLTGGKSQRMGRDKATMRYRGSSQPWALEALEMMTAATDGAYLSARQDQWLGTPLGEAPTLIDQIIDQGPMGGILSAFAHDPFAAWLVAACDLPFIDQGAFDSLIEQRNPFRHATAYQSASRDFPEPLFTIYEPKSAIRLFQALGWGIRCPRKVLINSPIQLLRPHTARTLNNMNSVEDLKHHQLEGSLQ